MDFCKQCRNMLYLRLENGKMQYHCKGCLEVSSLPSLQSASSLETGPGEKEEVSVKCVIDSNYTEDFHKQYVSPYIAYDPTLPRINFIPCTSKACTRPANRPHEVILVKYDSVDMRYLYYCCYCGVYWKTLKTSKPG